MPVKPVLGQAIGTTAATPGSAGQPGGPGGAASPYAGSGWELGVFDAASGYSNMLCMVPQRVWTNFTITKLLNDQGTGTVVLNLDDPFWTTTTLANGGSAPHYILDAEHVWRVYYDGIARFDFLGETITEQLLDPSEQRAVTVTGPGTIATLSWAMAAPPGFPSTIVYKTDALTDSFSEVNGSGQYVMDFSLWNASSPQADIVINPAGSSQIQATSGGTVLGTTVWDATNSLISAQVAPIVSPDPANVTLNGSELTQMYVQGTQAATNTYYAMIGMSSNALYAQYSGPDGTFTQVIATATQYQTAMSATYQYSYWQISEANGTFYFWTSPDGQTWKKVWSRTRHWDATQVGVYFSAKYTGSTLEYATVTSINSDIVTSSLGGATYLAEPIMDIYLQTLASAQQRGTVPFVTTRMTAMTDSFGTPWTDTQNVQIQNGTDLYSLLQGHTSMVDADFIMEPGFLLTVGLPTAGQISLGTDRSATVRFYGAAGITSEQRQRLRNQIQNLVAVINADSVTITSSNSGSISTWLQREAWIQAAAQVTAADLAAVASAASLQYGSEILSFVLQIPPRLPGRTPFKDFEVGDWVGLERPDFSAVDDVRVVGITVSVDANGNETNELVIQSYIQWLEERLQYIATKMGGGFVNSNGTTAISGNAQGSTLQAPTVFNISLQSLGVPNAGGPGGAPLVYNPQTGQYQTAGTNDPVTGSTLSAIITNSAGSMLMSGGGMTVQAPQPATPLNPNYNFPGGATAGWTTGSASGGTGGTLTTTSSPAGGSPQPYAGVLTPLLADTPQGVTTPYLAGSAAVTGTTTTVTLTSTVPAGFAMLVVLSVPNNTAQTVSVADSNGAGDTWTSPVTESNTNAPVNQSWLWSTIVSTTLAAGTGTVTVTTSVSAALLVEIIAVPNAYQIDVATGTTGTTTLAPAITSSAGTYATDWNIAFFGNNNSQTAGTPASWSATGHGNNGSNCLDVFYQATGVVTAFTCTSSFGTTSPFLAFAVKVYCYVNAPYVELASAYAVAVQAGSYYQQIAAIYLPTQNNLGIVQAIDWYDAHGNFLNTVSATTLVTAAQWQNLSFQAQAPGPAYDSQVFSGSPSLWFKLNDATGTTHPKDWSGYGNTGTVSGTVTFNQAFTPVPGNTSALFDGTSGYITAPMIGTGYTTLTVEGWFNGLSHTQNNPCALAGTSNTASDNCGFYLGLAGTTVTFSIGNGSAHTTVTTGSGVFPSTGWTHIAAVWDGVNVFLYVNGVLQASSTFSGPMAAGLAPGTVIAVNPVSHSGTYFWGDVGEVAVYPSPLSALAVALHADNLAVPGTGTGAAAALFQVGPAQGTTGAPLQIAQSELALVSASPSSAATSTSVIPSGTVVVDSGGTVRTVIGQQPDGTITSQDFNGPPGETPDTPTVTGGVQSVQVTWDGLLQGSAPLSDFFLVKIYLSTVSGFTPSASTLVGVMTKAGTYTVAGLAAGTIYYAVLTSFNTSGNESPPSSQAYAATLMAYDGALALLVPQVWLKLADAVGTTPVVDSSGNGYNGTPTGITLGEANQAIPGNTTALFNGTSGIVTTTYDPSAPTALSVNIWVNLNSLTQAGNSRLMNNAHSDVSTFQGFEVFLQGGTTPHFVMGNGSAATTVSGTAIATGNAWTMVTAVWTGTQMILYQNGVQTGTPAAFTSYVHPSTGAAIGAGVYAGDYLNGYLAEFSLFTVALTAQQVATLYASQNAGLVGGQILASTITATQIAAGTITAVEINAASIIAGVIDGATITGNVINGATFNGTNWIENPSGMYFYNSTPGVGTLGMAVTQNYGTDPQGNTVPYAGMTIYDTVNKQVVSTNGTTFSFGTYSAENSTFTMAQAQISFLPGSNLFQIQTTTSNVVEITPALCIGPMSSSPPTLPTSLSGGGFYFPQLYANANGNISAINGRTFSGQLAVTQADTNTYTNATTSYGAMSKAWSVPLNDPQVGTLYRLTAIGFGTQGSTQQILNLQATITGTQYAGRPIAAATIPISTGFSWKYIIEVLFVATGSSGNTARVSTTFNWSTGDTTGVTSSTESTIVTTPNAGIAVNTTVNNNITAQMAWASITGSPTITTAINYFERLGA